MMKKVLLTAVLTGLLVVAAQAQWIQGVTATTNSAYGAGNGADQLVIEEQLVGTQTWAQYYATGQWLSGGIYEAQQGVDWVPFYVDFDFGQSTVLNEMWIWNNGQILAPGRAIKNMTLTYSTDGGANYSVLGDYTLTEVPGLAGLADWTLFDATDVIDLGGLEATNVRIVTKSYVDGGVYEPDPDVANPWAPIVLYSLTQVAFTPEPATVGLLGAGLLGLLRRKR